MDRRIVRTVVALAYTLGLSVVAEGVERQSQADLLVKCRVDVVQGFHYAQPLNGEELIKTCKANPGGIRHFGDLAIRLKPSG